MALCKSDWAAAETYAKEAIANANSKLQVGEELLDGFNDYTANEWMWGYRYAETLEPRLRYFPRHVLDELR